MRIYQKKDFKTEYQCVVALGCFDGVHLGHRAVIERAVRISEELGAHSAVFSFSSSPKNFFLPNSAPSITDFDERSELIRQLGADVFVCYPFDAETANMSPADFFEDALISRLHAIHVVCGFNYTFGKGGEGNTDTLCTLCAKHGIGFTQLQPVEIDGITVSSSVIRSALEAGDVDKAERFLGHPYRITSAVRDGQHLARRLGFPTVNQVLSGDRLLPKNGVYLTRVTVCGEEYFGITNIGTRPTVESELLCAETHIFDFERNIYGETISVEPLRYMRPEVRFSSVDSLAEQVRADIAAAKSMISEYYAKKV